MKRAIILFIILSSFVSGQQGPEDTITLTGVVQDAVSRLPIADAKVTLPGIQASHEDYTDSKGVFTLVLSKSVKAGTVVRLKVEKTGYEIYEEKLSAATPLARPIFLTPASLQKGKPSAKSTSSRKLSVRGYVVTAEGAALPGVKVLIQGGPTSRETDPAGQFTINDITPPPDIGYPVTFEAIGWIIDEPFYLRQRGATYLPDPKAPPINLIVRKAGDQAFLQGPSIEKILGSRVYDFTESATQARLAHSALTLLHIEYVPTVHLDTSFYDSEGVPSDVGWDEFLADQAALIGIPLLELRAAIERWITHAYNPYQMGLAALYRGAYDTAATKFHDALDSNYVPRERLFTSLAYTEFKRGNFAESITFLKEISRLHPNDSTVGRNLKIVEGAAQSTKHPNDTVDEKRTFPGRSQRTVIPANHDEDVYPSVAQHVSLDKLSDCEGMGQTVILLQRAPSRRCRSYGEPIENKIMAQLRTVPNLQSCILEESPPQLSGFTCIRTNARDADGITCFRAINARALDDYVNHFDSIYSDKAARYEKATKACSVGNGHFASVERELFPKSLEAIAKPRFGFAIGIDSSSKMHGQAYHGFADVDPDLTSYPKAIEIFDIFQTGHIEQTERGVVTEDANSFEIETEDVEAAAKADAAWLHSQTGSPSTAKVRLITLKYRGKKEVTISERRSNLDEWQKGIVSVLKGAGFRDYNESDGGEPNFDSLREMIIKNSPIANRKFSDDSLGPHIVGLTTDNQRCLEFATIFVLEPVAGRESDYGGFFIQLAGVGDCHREETSSGVLSEERFNDMVEYLKGQL